MGHKQSQNQSETLRATERERLRALVDADMETAYQMHAEDFQLITPLGMALSREQYLGQIVSGEIDYLAWEPGEAEVRLYGNVRYQAALQIVVKGSAKCTVRALLAHGPV